MYFPLGKYMTGVARVKPGPASGRASRAVTRRWRQVRPGGASGLSFDALCRRISLLVVRSAVMVMPALVVPAGKAVSFCSTLRRYPFNWSSSP